MEEILKKLEELERQIIELKFELTKPSEPECPYKEGELIFVRDEDSEWYIVPSTGEFKKGKVETYCFQNYKDNEHNTTVWQFHASTNGLKLPE